MKEFFAKKYIKCILIVEFILLAAGLVYVFMPKNEYSVSVDEMEYTDGCIKTDVGLFIDDSISKGGYFIYGPSFDIKKGSYEVTLKYKTQGGGNYVTVSGLNQNYNSVLVDDFYLSPDFEEQKFTVWVQKNIDDFAVSVIYDGTSELTVNDIHIRELTSGRVYLLLKLFAEIMAVNIIIWLILCIRNGDFKKYNLEYTLAILAMAVVASYPLFTTYLTEGDDLVYHLLRIEGIKDGLLSGQFPVRIHPIQFRGYGYANSVFYGELFLYIPAILRLCGMPLQTAYKFFIILVNISTALITFKCMESIFKDRKIALLCSFLYVFAPYRLTNIYVRAAVGEFCAMTFWPVIACGLYHLFADDINAKEYKRNWIILTLGYSGLIQTHLLSCEIGAVVSAIICLVMFRRFVRSKTIVELIKFFASTVLLNAFYLVPLITYMIRGGISIIDEGTVQTHAIQENGIYISQLFNLFVNGSGMAYGHAVSAYKELGMYGEMGITVGISLLLCAVLFICLLVYKYNEIKKEKFYKITLIACVCGIVSVYMATSSFPWDDLCRCFGSVVYNLQFPWRMFSVSTIFLTITAAGTFIIAKKYLSKDIYVICTWIIAATTLVTAMFMMYDRLSTSKAVYTYDSTAFFDHGSGSLNEYLPTATDAELLDVFEPVTSENVIVNGYEKEYTNINLDIKEEKGEIGLVTLPLLNYLGYEAKDSNGEKLGIVSDSNGVMQLIIPAGFDGNITVRYAGPWFWHVGEIISLIFVAIFICLGIKYYRRQSDI